MVVVEGVSNMVCVNSEHLQRQLEVMRSGTCLYPYLRTYSGASRLAHYVTLCSDLPYGKVRGVLRGKDDGCF